MLETILNPVLSPLLYLPPLLSIIIISTFISLFITLIYKFTTNQSVMKDLRDRLKQYQDDIKKNKGDTKKALELQKKAMELNMEYMKHSFRATLFTIIPIAILFGWFNAHMAYYPLMPNEAFTTTAFFKAGVSGTVGLEVPEGIMLLSNKSQNIENGLASWDIQGTEGKYILDYKYGNKTFSKEIIITSERLYEPAEKQIKDTKIQLIKVNNEKVIYLNLLGWKLGWLGTYILFSIITSSILRKILKVY
jgi:uncharacterized membrane protein (DUF106 family)